MTRALLLSLLSAMPAAAQTRAPAPGAIAGRSPPVAHRGVGPAARSCGSARPALPAGKLPVFGGPAPCPTAGTVAVAAPDARAAGGEPLVGR